MCSFDTVLSIFDMTPLGSFEYFKNTWCILTSWTVASVDAEVNVQHFQSNGIQKIEPLLTSGVTGGGGSSGRQGIKVPLETFDREISAALLGKKRQGKKG